MYVCFCAAVSSATVVQAIDAGARTVEEVGDRCGAGTMCGGCHDTIRTVLASHRPGKELSWTPP